MKKVRIAIIGVGGMGNTHARSMAEIERADLTAVCDIDPRTADTRAREHGCKGFYSAKDLLASRVANAVLIATPHYAHTTIGIQALKAGMHVLVEKPISAHKADCKRLIAAHANKRLVFAAMFNQRTDPHYKKIKQLVDSGELGELTRVSWIISDWFRTEAYYASGGWRATWKGEGGGVLLNQCPHNLDLLQWICGMPGSVRAFCGIGKHHAIEVEDEVTAYLEYPNGATGVLVTSTGEAPGTNRLEICGEMGKIVLEHGKLTFDRNEIGQKEFCKTSTERFARPGVHSDTISVEGTGGQHLEIIRNFVDAILDRTPLIAPAAEGIHSVELANAMLYSSMIGAPVRLPLNAANFRRLLQRLIRESTFEKKTVRKASADDIAKSF
ncbi:MAG: gfo/Idh/MocA family oxidoreductase [Chitinivibrionales bacterium]|nr:gfo/Idh/MocA family oxidoreductase [Chitinivibrionales bacterium]MBD3395451.1 gfo/Idh/MocA family oxidoreductase [Chitinivibrionales bacterium]